MAKNEQLAKIPKEHRKGVEDDVNRIITVIKKRRAELGITQEELAELANLAPISIQAIEQFRRSPSFEVLLLLCRILKIRIRLD